MINHLATQIQMPSIDTLFAGLLQHAHTTALVRIDEDSHGKGKAGTRFPTQVDAETRVFLEHYAAALGTSLAALSGAILNQVVRTTMADISSPKK